MIAYCFAETAFKQQQLPAWQPILTLFPVIVSFLVIGIAFIPIGVALLFASTLVRIVVMTSNVKVVEVSQR